jgi:hypothetical protein
MERAYTGPPVDDEEKKAGLLKKGMLFRLSVLRQLNEDAYQSVLHSTSRPLLRRVGGACFRSIYQC